MADEIPDTFRYFDLLQLGDYAVKQAEGLPLSEFVHRLGGDGVLIFLKPRCEECDGSGAAYHPVDNSPCRACGGSGYQSVTVLSKKDFQNWVVFACRMADYIEDEGCDCQPARWAGTERLDAERCHRCTLLAEARRLALTRP